MKDTFFFTHDFGARNDPKLQNVLMEHGCEGLGVFWCIVEMIYEQGGNLPLSNCKSIAFALHVDSKIVERVIKEFDLFENDGVVFWSKSINSRLEKRADIAEKRKKAAASSWESRRAKQMQSNHNANAMGCNAIKEKERKEKERKENTSLNKEDKKVETAKRFTPPSIDEVKSYISEKGYSVDAESFVAFYTSKNWFVGKNKMKDWRAAVVTWEKRQPKSSNSSKVNDIWEK
jgi:hypothetical protein